MIDTATTYAPTAYTRPAQDNPRHDHGASHKILHWQDHDRMAGRIPVWSTAKTAQDTIALTLGNTTNAEKSDFATALSYTDSGASPHNNTAFGFGDLIDMVNPLHHIPLVGHLYRELTGDDIKPISRIIGGGLFGGGIGAASGLIDTVIEYETGHDTATNALALVTDGTFPTAARRTTIARSLPTGNGATSTINTLSAPTEPPLSTLGTAIAFADLGHSATPKPAHNTPHHNGGYRFRVND